jgi:CheY-like chemotaxis protein
MSVSDEAEEVVPEVMVRGSLSETVLVVEDDSDVRSFSCDTLSDLGYSVLEADNARVGLRLLEANPNVRLLFTDVGLPGGMNGRQLADHARKLRPGLKVLFTTGYARNAIVHDGRLDAGVDLITKPFTQAALGAKLRDILDAARSPGRILLVEDEVLVQMLAVEYLESAGYHVDTAGTATDAINKLALTPGGMDAIIIDIGLPDRRGDELLREIRTLYPSLPVVLATGHTAADVRVGLRETPSVAVVTKPYLEKDLIGALQKLGLRGRSSPVD